MTLLEAALSYVRAGLSVLPCELPDKNPAYHLLPRKPDPNDPRKTMPTWDPFKERIATEDEVRAWFDHPRPPEAIGIVAGRVSGGLEVLDIDDRALVQPWAEIVKELEPETFGALVVEETMRRRAHVFWRVPGAIVPCQKLAMGSLDEGGKGLIETKAEGGYVCVAPSKGYRMVRGSFEAIPTITQDQRDLLIQVGRAFTRASPVEDAPRPKARPGAAIDGDRPGDQFNRDGDWRSVAKAHGWEFARQRGDVEYWRRPGKERGISASWNHVPNALYVFTTNGHPLQDGKAYSPFAMLATLDHRGDYSAAAKALHAVNRGPQSWPDERRTKRTEDPPTPTDAQAQPETALAPPTPDGPPAYLRVVPTDPDARERPAIYAGQADLGMIVDSAWAAIDQWNRPRRLFRFGDSVASVGKNADGLVVVRRTGPDAMREAMARAGRWYLKKPGKKAEKYDAKPPLDVAKVMLAGQGEILPPLNRTISCPIMSPSGEIVSEPGYHAETRTYYVAGGLPLPSVPDSPTDANVAAARDLLGRELLGDFPFIEHADGQFYHSPDRAHALAMFILPFARELVDGPTPLHLVEKPTPGSGASLLFQALGRLVTGGDPTAITEATGEDEWRKRITSTLLGTPEIVAIDNLRRRLDSSALAKALTDDVWEDRLLGVSSNVRIPVRSTWIATGNNPGVSNEIARRCVSIRLDSMLEKPWEREPASFRHPNLLRWTTENRPRLMAAALTMLRAWHARGRPTGGQSLGSYEAWAGVIGGVLKVAGVEGFLGNRASFYERADREAEGWEMLLAAWWEHHGADDVTASALHKLVDAGVEMDLGGRGKTSERAVLGALLSANRGKRVTVDGVHLMIQRGKRGRLAWNYSLIDLGDEGGDNV